jgi:hypothetical protein
MLFLPILVTWLCLISFPFFRPESLPYEIVFSKKRHKAVSKDSGKTNYKERFNNTMRQRIPQLVRKTLSFSKKLSNHLGAIGYFIDEYNASLSIEPKA